ncbi:MAG: helix-turn-helix transcriptional regulator [Lachnospiraceae bacterium]|nr:helix-turn-helix transcriptional regulator [Lachnospiraceae bacterium]
MNIGERLSELRRDLGYKQKEIAAYLSVGVSTISNYETGTHQPDLESLCMLADFFHVSTDYLLGRTKLTLSIDSLNEPAYEELAKVDVLKMMDQLTELDYHYLVKTLRMLHYQQQLDAIQNRTGENSTDTAIGIAEAAATIDKTSKE